MIRISFKLPQLYPFLSDVLYYRPQRICGKECFYTCLSFCPRGGWQADTPLACRHPPGRQTPPGSRPPPTGQTTPAPPRTATAASYWNWNTRILLECILVARCERTLINCATFVQLRTTSSEHVSDIETLNFDKYRNSVKIKLCEMKSELQCLC